MALSGTPQEDVAAAFLRDGFLRRRPPKSTGREDFGDTNPVWDFDDDRDWDGLNGAEEVLLGTDPADADTDDDGLLDGNCGSEDLNANGSVDPGETSPLDPDSDNDGIYDGTEMGLTAPEVASATDMTKGFFVADGDPASVTDPTNADSDGDGLEDGQEDANKNGAVDALETSPINMDSDGDGYSDGAEVSAGSNPLDSTSTPPSDDDDSGGRPRST